MAGPRSPVLLLDADILAYRAASVHQRVVDWGDGVTSVATDPPEEAIETLRRTVREMCKLLDGTPLYCLTSELPNYRKAILPTYKANRSVKPVLLPALREWMISTGKARVRPHLEGDDVMGILATTRSLLKGRPRIIVSIDKDMKTIPGTLYNPGTNDLRKVSVEEADYWHMFQTLTGDTTDNYKGCPGVGPVNAARILDEGGGSLWSSVWERVVAEYATKKLTEADALVQARVARILRGTDFNFKTKEPRLWMPPS